MWGWRSEGRDAARSEEVAAVVVTGGGSGASVAAVEGVGAAAGCGGGAGGCSGEGGQLLSAAGSQDREDGHTILCSVLDISVACGRSFCGRGGGGWCGLGRGIGAGCGFPLLLLFAAAEEAA